MEDQQARDDRLVRTVLQGDRGVFAVLVTRYQKLVAGVAWRYGAGRDEIEDVVSEVFLKLYQNLHQYRPEHPFPTWLYRLAANHVLDRARRARKERGRAPMPRQLTDPGPGAAQAAESGERVALLRAALRELDPRYQEAIRLVYVEGMKVDEAARFLELPVGTVKTRLMRGRQALKKILVHRHPEYFEV